MNSTDNSNKALNPEELMRLGFDESTYDDDHWYDIDVKLRISKLPDGTYQQYYEEEDQHIGVPLKTVGELQLRYHSLTGHELKYYEGAGYPRNQ